MFVTALPKPRRKLWNINKKVAISQTNFDSLFFHAEAASTQKTICILMQLIHVPFRPLSLENICSRLLRSQMIMMMMVIPGSMNLLNAPHIDPI